MMLISTASSILLLMGYPEILTVTFKYYNSYIVPVLDQLAAKISEIMAGPVGDAIHNAIELIGKIVDALKVLWKTILVLYHWTRFVISQ